MRKIIILGCGPVGKHIAIDLCKDAEFEVTSVDINREALAQLSKEHPIRICVVVIGRPAGATRVAEAAVFGIGALPGC